MGTSAGVRTRPITMEDAAAVGLSILRNLDTEGGMKKANKVEGETHPCEVLECKTCRIFPVELAESEM